MKRIYLAQHAFAYDSEVEPSRPLTPEGERDATLVAKLLKHHITVSEIYHSGKLRAKQTADIFCDQFDPVSMVQEIEGLKPMDDPQIIANHIETSTNNVLYVGHLPHLSKLAGLLINGDTNTTPVNFINGGVVSLIRENEVWEVDWIITPSLVSQPDTASSMYQ